MARTKRIAQEDIDLEFPRTGNPWIDAGTVGLYRVLNRRPPYLDAGSLGVVDEEGASAFRDVRCDSLGADRLVVSGPKDQVQAALEWAYERLVATYYSVSSAKQRADRNNHNFYYDSIEDRFVIFPKVKSAGAASLLFDKAVRPAGKQVRWKHEPDGKPQPGRLPEEYAHLQDRLDAFLAEEGLKPGPPAGLLIDGPNQVRPKVEIRADAAGAKATCFLEGAPAAAAVEAKETAFPLLGGSRSFINGNTNWPRLSWKADFVGKFVPVLAFFYQQGDDLHLFFPQANDLGRIDELADRLTAMVRTEPNLFRNFDLLLGGYFRRRSEVTLAFLHRVFVELSHQEGSQRGRKAEAAILADTDDTNAETEPEISAQAVFDATQRDRPISFSVVSATKKGNVWMARDFWTFRDLVYLSRLFARMQLRVQSGSGVMRRECSPVKFAKTLVDYEAKDENRTILRDRVTEAILRRESVLRLLERHAYHINTHTDASKARLVGPLLDFAKLYEVELRKETPMEDTYRKMVETATWLGGNVGKALAEAVKDPQEKEPRGRARGALFRLRKTRTVADFMNELARLQVRYEIDIPKDALDPATVNHETFEDFRGFCVVAALNRFLYATREQTPRPTEAQ